MSNFQPWVRRYNYISDFFNTTYEIYVKNYPAFPVNYYRFNTEESVYDESELGGGSYEKLGVGEDSGYVWDKILMLPVFGLEQVYMQQDSAEMGGMNYRESMISVMNIPDIYGFRPVENDIIDISFGMKNTKNHNRALYVISNVNPAHFGEELQIYRCDIKAAPFDRSDIEKQIFKYYMFYDPIKEILPITNATLLNKITARSEIINSNLSELFNSQTNFYLETFTL